MKANNRGRPVTRGKIRSNDVKIVILALMCVVLSCAVFINNKKVNEASARLSLLKSEKEAAVLTKRKERLYEKIRESRKGRKTFAYSRDELALLSEIETEAEGAFAECESISRDANETSAQSIHVLDLQGASRSLLLMRYGVHDPYAVELSLAHPGGSKRVLLQMAPMSLMPYSVLTFLEMARGWKGGFAYGKTEDGRALKISVDGSWHNPAFAEFSAFFPESVGRVGLRGEFFAFAMPGPDFIADGSDGPELFVSLMDSSLQSDQVDGVGHAISPKNCFADIIDGFEEAFELFRGEFSPIRINKAAILVKSEDGTFREWKEGSAF